MSDKKPKHNDATNLDELGAQYNKRIKQATNAHERFEAEAGTGLDEYNFKFLEKQRAESEKKDPTKGGVGLDDYNFKYLKDQLAEHEKKYAQETIDKFKDISLDDVKPHLDTLSKKLLSIETLQSLPADFRDASNKQR